MPALYRSLPLPPDLFSPSFDYSIVDGLGRARQRGVDPQIDGAVFRASTIGPVIELCNLRVGESLAHLRSADWFDEAALSALLDGISSDGGRWLERGGSRGLLKGEAIEDDSQINSFKIDAHKAALTLGFGKAAPLIVAAMGELIGNVTDHSEAKQTGIAVFSISRGTFEFVVADKGIGALASLTTNTAHSRLQDEGAALSAMVETGISRFNAGTGHGYGFRPIFERLADMTGELRFRSGDYALTLDGRFGDRISRRIVQKPEVRGLFAAVTCHVPDGSERS